MSILTRKTCRSRRSTLSSQPRIPRHSLDSDSSLSTFSSKILCVSSTCHSGWLTGVSSSGRGLDCPQEGADSLPGINTHPAPPRTGSYCLAVRCLSPTFLSNWAQNQIIFATPYKKIEEQQSGTHRQSTASHRLQPTCTLDTCL